MQSTLKTLCIGLAAASSLMIGNSVVAADGQQLYNKKMCQTCHGADAKTPTSPIYPKLAGQNEAYLVTQIKDIRDGKRTNAMSSVMKAMLDAFKVNDKEVKIIAKWIASQPTE